MSLMYKDTSALLCLCQRKAYVSGLATWCTRYLLPVEECAQKNLLARKGRLQEPCRAQQKSAEPFEDRLGYSCASLKRCILQARHMNGCFSATLERQ